MKSSLLAISVLILFAFAAPVPRAQAYDFYYGPGPDLQYQQQLEWQRYQDYLRQIDPYYELHVMHYQLYRQSHQSYFVYTPCCYAVGIPTWTTPFRRVPHGPKSRPPKAVRGR